MSSLAVLLTTLLLVLVLQALLGLFVLGQPDGRLASRFLGTYLVIHPFPYAAGVLFTLLPLLGVAVGPGEARPLLQFGLVLLAFVPSFLVGLALLYPRPVRALERRPAWVALAFVPPVVAVLVDAAQGGQWYLTRAERPAPGIEATFGVQGLMFFAVAFLAAGSFVAGATFLLRAQRAPTSLERRRLRYMGAAIAAPLALSGLAALGATMVEFLGGRTGVPGDVGAGLTVAAVLVMLVVPPFAVAYGVLRYQMADVDLRARAALRAVLVIAALLTAYVASDGVARAAGGTAGTASMAAVGATLIVALLFLRRLARAADALALRLVPTAEPEPVARGRRRSEVYRAVFEERTAQARPRAADRRELDRLAERLGLAGAARSLIEEEVGRERAQAFGRPKRS